MRSSESASALAPAAPTLDRDPRALLRYAHEAVRHRCPVPLRHRTEDIAQSLVVRLLQRSRAANGVTLTPAYVRVAAGHAVADEIRTSIRRRSFWEVNASAIQPEGANGGQRPDVSDHGLVGCIRAQWRQLDPEAASAVLRYLNGESMREIAVAMGWNPKKASNTVFRTLGRLRKRLISAGITARDVV